MKKSLSIFADQKATRIRQISLPIFRHVDAELGKPFHQDGDLVFCPDGTIILGTKAFHRRAPIDFQRNSVRIFRPKRSRLVQVQFARGEKKFFSYRRFLVWWTWYECFYREEPRSLFGRMFRS